MKQRYNHCAHLQEEIGWGILRESILAGRILNHLISDGAKKVVPEFQCGVCARSYLRHGIAILQLQEKCREPHLGLCILFVNLNNAFDTVNHKCL